MADQEQKNILETQSGFWLGNFIVSKFFEYASVFLFYQQLVKIQ